MKHLGIATNVRNARLSEKRKEKRQAKEKMTNEDIKRWKAKQLLYKKAKVSGLNIYDIQDALYIIKERCDEIEYNWLDDDIDDEYKNEFQILFSDVFMKAERLSETLEEFPNYGDDIDYFDCFIGSIAKASSFEFVGFNNYEDDYFPLSDSFEKDLSIRENKKRIMKQSKEKLLSICSTCFSIIVEYLELKNDFDNLNSAYEILAEKQNAFANTVKEIEKLYDLAEKENFYPYCQETKKLNDLLKHIPDELWVG